MFVEPGGLGGGGGFEGNGGEKAWRHSRFLSSWYVILRTV